MRLPWISKLQVVALFAFAGPPLGALLEVATSVQGLSAGKGVDNSFLFYAYILAFAIPYSYIFGIVPAALTGLATAACWSVLNRSLATHRTTRALLGAVWGYVFTYGFIWWAFGPESLNRSRPIPLEAVGAVSGLLCAAIVPVAWVSPNNSSKPTPLRGAA